MLNFNVKDAGRPVPYAFPYMETMADRIRTLRKAKGLTQEGLGKLCGVSKSAVSQWEDGSTKNLKLEEFLTLVDVLGTDPHYIVFGEERSPTGKHRRPVAKPKATGS